MSMGADINIDSDAFADVSARPSKWIYASDADADLWKVWDASYNSLAFGVVAQM